MAPAVSLFDEGPPPPCPERFNIAAHVLGKAHNISAKPALEVLHGADRPPQILTFGDIGARIRSAITGLRAAGIGRGDRVALRLGNTPDFPVLFFAATGIGALPVPVSAALTPPEIAHVLDDLDATAILLGDGLDAPHRAGTARIGPGAIRSFDGLPPGEFADTAANDPAYIVYTSGTSGRPKGVLHAHRAAWARQMMWRDWYGLHPDDRVLHAGAFNWTYTLGTGLTDPWAAGATALICAAPPDRARWPAIIARHRPTILAAVPGIFRQILSTGLATPDALASLRHGLSAGEGLPEALRTAWKAATGTPLFQALGQSECSTYLSFSHGFPPERAAHPASTGRPQAGRRIAILPPDGTDPVPCGTEGQIAIHRRDPGLMLGYWQRPGDTAAAFRGDWFLTGDSGRMQSDGCVTHLGRMDDVMNAGGFRVSPAEVEAVIAAFPGVAEAAVAEVEVRADVRIIAAFVVAPSGLAIDGLAAHCAANLAAWKCPREFCRVASLPRGPNGKLLRKRLAALWAPADRQGRARP
jgi:acyl-coenzyme A synthetase/AMP-(fatty) acid ligase